MHRDGGLEGRRGRSVDTEIAAIQVAVAERDLPATASAARRLRTALAGIRPTS
jgi:hypothetical protein